MSAKRRQETLETFCVPIEHDTNVIPDVQSTPAVPMSEVQPTRRSSRSSRRGQPSAGDLQQEDAISINSDDDDFVPHMDIDNEDDADGAPTRSKKGKGKAKGKSKGKGKAAARSQLGSLEDTVMNGVNPKVMLISLKAGALGLNLTVANNIYL